MAALPISYGQDFGGKLLEPNGTTALWGTEAPAVLFTFEGIAGDPLNIRMEGLNAAGTEVVWSCYFFVVHESGQVVFQDFSTSAPLVNVLPLDGAYQIILGEYQNGPVGADRNLFRGHLYLPASLKIEPSADYVLGEPVRLTPTIPDRFSASLPGIGALKSGVTILDKIAGGSKTYTASISGCGAQEEILLGQIDQDSRSILPGSPIQGNEWSFSEWHFYGQGGEDVWIDLISDSAYQVFRITLSPLIRGEVRPVEWTRVKAAKAGEGLHFHAVLPETGAYRIELFFGQYPS